MLITDKINWTVFKNKKCLQETSLLSFINLMDLFWKTHMFWKTSLLILQRSSSRILTTISLVVNKSFYYTWCSNLSAPYLGAASPLVLSNFCFKVLMWSLKSWSSPNKSTKYLVQVFCLIYWPLNWKFIFLVIFFLGDWKITISVLLIFKTILFALSHWTRFDRSKREPLVYNGFESSVKWCIFEFFIDQLKSFMYMGNNKGLKIEG